jgi:hypothetical protein
VVFVAVIRGFDTFKTWDLSLATQCMRLYFSGTKQQDRGRPNSEDWSTKSWQRYTEAWKQQQHYVPSRGYRTAKTF